MGIRQDNYKKMTELFPEIMSGETSHIKLQAGEGFMPLSVEKIGADRISMSHHYEQNGDLMADPDMELVLDTEKGTVSARTYQQDNLGVFQRVEDNSGQIVNPRLERELNSFLGMWLDNIRQQEYKRIQERPSIHEALEAGKKQAAEHIPNAAPKKDADLNL